MLELYVTSDDPYFDAPYSRPGQPGCDFDFSGSVPTHWETRDIGIWRHYQPPATEPREHGWKVHVSATQADAPGTLEVVAKHCFAANLPFKHLRTAGIHLLMDSKSADRKSSGKFIAIYPPDSYVAVDLAEQLDVLLAGRSGPYIITDMRWRSSPVYLRYGAFQEFYTEVDGVLVPALPGGHGEWVPDSRPPFELPAGEEVPEAILERHRQGMAAAHADFPYHGIEALHFSNSGGVYLARRNSDEVRVILKEGRRHAGLDANGDDGATRIAHEGRVLERLHGIEGIPEIYRSFTAWENFFIEIEYIEGTPLNSFMGRLYPLTSTFPAAAARRNFRARMQPILRTVRRAVEQVHEQGFVVGDIHPRNILVRDDGSVCLIDLETAAQVDTDRGAGMGHPGYSRRGLSGFERDRYALEMLEVAVYAPMAELLSFDRGKLPYVKRLKDSWFPADLAPGGPDEPGIALPDLDIAPLSWRDVAHSVLDSATPTRTDRLYPGDPAQFSHHPASFAHGAGGVLWALAGTGVAAPPKHVSWLRDVSLRYTGPRIGLYDGYGGAMLALAGLGLKEEASALAERLFHALGSAGDHGLSLGHGAAGAAACLTTLPSWQDSPDTQRLIEYLITRCGAEISYAERNGSRRPPGLEYGYSGIAVALLHLADLLDDPRLPELARRAVELDLQGTVTSSDGARLVNHGGRLLPYVGIGTAGVLLAVRELALRDLQAPETLWPLALACGAVFVIQPQFGFGRTGLLAALSTLASPHDDTLLAHPMKRHAALLALYALERDSRTTFLGEQLVRCSMDFMTGAAGVARTLAAVEHSTLPVLPFISSRSRNGSGVYAPGQFPTPLGGSGSDHALVEVERDATL